MTDIVLPLALHHASSRFTYVDSSGIARGVYGGIPQTTALGGDRITCSVTFTPVGGPTSTQLSLQRQLRAFIMRMRGKQNRVFLTDSSYTRAGSFSASELLANPDFSNGTTGWGASGNGALSVSDGVLKLTATASGAQLGFAGAATFVAYAPYVMRSIAVDGAQTAGLSAGPILYNVAGTISATDYSTTRGYRIAMLVPEAAGVSAGAYPLNFPVTSGYTAGAFALVQFASVSRCLLADGGSNMALQSDTLATTWSVANASVGTNAAVAPDGTTTAEEFDENGASAEHTFFQDITVTAATGDHVSSCCFFAAGRTWVVLRQFDTVSGSEARCYFNMATGAVGTASIAAGSVFASARGYARSLGSNWWQFYLVTRKTTAVTSIRTLFTTSTADGGSLAPAGISANAYYFWRAGFQRSSVPGRTVVTVAAAATAESQTGIRIYVKGGRAPGEGTLASALIAGDWIEVDGQILGVTAPLDLDSAGMGELHCSPPPLRPIADNTPIILHRPMGRFVFAGDSSGWDNEPGVITHSQLDFEEAYS